MTHEDYCHRLAPIVIEALSMKPGQRLAVKGELDHAVMMEALAVAAYQRGASYVDAWIESSRLVSARVRHSAAEYLDLVPSYLARRNRELVEREGAIVSLRSPVDPAMLVGSDPFRLDRIAAAQRAVNAEYRRAVLTDRIPWVVTAVPTAGWAGAVLGVAPSEDARIQLWERLAPILRLEHSDPARFWKSHAAALGDRADRLSRLAIRELRVSGAGSDITIGLPDAARWLGGSSATPDGTPFLPNLPTEEVFTAPHRLRVNGRLRTTRPVPVYDSLVSGAWFDFRDGRVVDAGADQGADLLTRFLDSAPECRYAGEVAIVAGDSPVYQSGLVFGNILLDENAACHLALGAAYPACVIGGAQLSDDERAERGLNGGTEHTDFMFGSNETRIEALCGDGTRRVLLENGAFVLPTGAAAH